MKLRITLNRIACFLIGTITLFTYWRSDARPIFQNSPHVTIKAASAIAFESGNTEAVLIVSRDGSTTQALTVRLTIGGSATNGVDYTATPTQVQIPGGATSTEIHIKSIDDSIVEPDETVTIALADVPAATTFDNTLASVVIEDNDTVVTVTATNANGSESGPQPIVFRFTRVGDVRSQLEVKYFVNSALRSGGGNVSLGDGSVRTISDGTSNTVSFSESGTTSTSATAGVDFTEPPGTLTFQIGESSKQLSIMPIDDAVPEARESLTINLLRSQLYTIGTSGSAVGFIDDNDQTVPTVSISSTQPNANEEGAVAGTFTITRSGSSPQPLTVFYSVNGSGAGNIPNAATNGVDFQQLSGQAVIPAGVSSVTVNVVPIDDSENEPEERIVIQLVNAPTGTYQVQPTTNSVTIKIKDHHKQ